MTERPERPDTGLEGASPGGSEADDAGASGEAGDSGRDDLARAAASCELCGAPVVERHCKIVCLNCGYTRDCSDP